MLPIHVRSESGSESSASVSATASATAASTCSLTSAGSVLRGRCSPIDRSSSRVVAISGSTSGQRSANQVGRRAGSTSSSARSARAWATAVGRLPASSTMAPTNTSIAHGRPDGGTASDRDTSDSTQPQVE